MSGDCPNCLVQVDGETGVRCCTRAGERRHEGRAAERHVLARARPARDERHEDRAQVPAGRLLLQDADQAALAVAQGRADDPQGRGPRQGRQERPAPPPRARLPPPRRRRAGRGPGRPGRRARRRRGRRLGDRGRRGRARAAGSARARRSTRCASCSPQVEAHERIELLRDAPRVRALRGPRGAADRARPARDDAAQGDRRRDRRVRVDGGLPGQRRAGRDARRAARCASRRSTRSSPANVAVVLAGTHEVGEHVARPAGGRHRGRRRRSCPTAPTTAPELPDGVRTIVGEIVQVHGKKRVKAVSVRYTGGTEKIECDLLCLSGSLTPQENLLRQGTAMPVHAAGDLLAPAPVAESVAHAREVGGAGGARRGRRAAGARPEGAALRRRRLRLHLRGRLRAGRAQRRDRGLLLDRAAQALHDDHDGPLPGPHVPRPDAHARRAPLARRRAAHLLDDDGPPAGARGHARRGHAPAPTRTSSGAPRCTTCTSASARRSCGPASGSASTTTARSSASTARCARASASSTSARSASSASPGPTSCAFLERLYPNHVGDIQPGPPALRAAARRARRDPRRRHDLPHRRRDLLPHGHDLGRRGGRGADDRLARHLGHDGAHRQPDLRARRDQRRRPEGARGARDADRGRHLAGGLPLPAPAPDHGGRASRASRSGSASWARSAGSCTTPRRAPRSCGPRCWRPASRTASQPFGIQAQRLLRLEKGHIIVSQDTDFETTPWRVDMGWAVKLEKDWFVGKRALVRKQETPTEKLIAYRGESGSRKAPWEGAAVKVDGKLVGRVTSSWYSWYARPFDRPGLGQARVRGRGPAPADRQGQHDRERRQGRLLRPRGGEAPCLSTGRSPRPRSCAPSARRTRSTRSRRRPACAPGASPATRCCGSASRGASSELLDGAAVAARGSSATAPPSSTTATATRSSRSPASEREELFARLSSIRIPAAGGFVQGNFAGVPARIFCGADRLEVIVTSDVAWFVGGRLEHAGHEPRARAEDES